MNVWEEARMGIRGGTRHALGMWDPRYRLASLAFLPPVSERRKLYGKKRFVYLMNVTFPTGGVVTVLSDRITLTSDFWMTDLKSSSNQQSGGTGIVSMQLYDKNNRYTNIPTYIENVAGDLDNGGLFSGNTAITRFPFFFRRISRLPAGTVLTARFNQTTPEGVPWPVQLAVGGYIE